MGIELYLGMNLEEQRAELKDNILRLLADLKDEECRDISWLSETFWRSFDTCYVVIGELEDTGKEGYVVTREHFVERFPNDKNVWITPEGRYFIDHDSYLSRLERESEKIDQAIKAKPKITTQVISIGIAIIFGFSMAYVSWLQYFDNIELKEVKIENELLKRKLDSVLQAIQPTDQDSARSDSIGLE